MKKICSFALGLLVTTCGYVQSAETLSPITGEQAAPAAVAKTNFIGPRIKFAKLIHDFGKITGGAIVKTKFIFTNIGDKTLEVTSVNPSCGCTMAGEWTRQVEPGKTGSIPLEFNSGNFNNVVIKTATVTCNDTASPVLTLQLKANIWRPIEITPQLAILQLTTETPSNATTVKILNNVTNSPLTLSEVESKNPAFAAELVTVKEGTEYDLIVKTLPPYPTNNVQGQITIKSSSSNMPVISVTAYANVQPTVVAMPGQLALSPGPLTNKVSHTVWVRNNGTNSITVSDPVINVKGAEVQLSAFQQGRYFSLAVTFPAGLLLDPAENPELTVKTSHASYPVLKIPVVQPRPAGFAPKGPSPLPLPEAPDKASSPAPSTAGH